MAKRKPQLVPFVNKYSIKQHNDYHAETFKLPSLAVPGESISITEMIRRHVAGEIPPLAMSAFHGYDVDMDEHIGKPMQDLTELDELGINNDRSSVGESVAPQSGSVAEAPQSGAQAIEETTSEASTGKGEQSSPPPPKSEEPPKAS